MVQWILNLFQHTEAPGSGSVKFNIQKRLYVTSNQNFGTCDQANGLSASTSTTSATSVSSVTTAATAGTSQTGWDLMHTEPCYIICFCVLRNKHKIIYAPSEQGERLSLWLHCVCLCRPQDWPQAMKEYVQRCFTACETEEDKDRTEKVLKEILQSRLQDGSAFTIDWTREPLPEWVASFLVHSLWH